MDLPWLLKLLNYRFTAIYYDNKTGKLWIDRDYYGIKLTPWMNRNVSWSIKVVIYE